MYSELLETIPLFSELPKAELEYLASNLRVVDFDEGAIIFRENEVGDVFYIVISGKVEVVLALGTSDEKVLAHFGKGDFVGEMSLFVPEGHRSASGRVIQPAKLWMMTRQDFDELLHRQPLLAYTMVKILADRLNATNNAAFLDLQEKNRQLQAAFDQLKEAQEQIIEKERIERELQVAAGIQMSILPDHLPSVGCFDFGACISPARAVGGDFYDLILLGNNRVGILVGDVADKGVPSAIFMARTHALIVAEAAEDVSPGEVLRRVNTHLTQMKTSDLFVTVLYGILNCSTGEFRYARAGHEVPLLFTDEGVNRFPLTIGQPIGFLEAPIFDEQKIILQPGHTMLIFTDGLTDCRNPEREPFGSIRLRTKFQSLGSCTAQEVCDGLLDELTTFQAGIPQDDDVTIMAIHAGQIPNDK